MQRNLLSVLVLSIALLAALPAEAGEPAAREVERMAAKFERLFQSLTGAAAREDLVFKDHGGGFYSLRLELDGVQRTSLEARNDDPKPTRLLAAGHMASEPTSPSASVNAIVSSPETAYNIWWAAVNQTEEAQTLKTTIKITGPEEFIFQVSDKVDYPANAVQFIWFNPEILFSAPGIYAHRTVIKSAGKNLYKFLVE